VTVNILETDYSLFLTFSGDPVGLRSKIEIRGVLAEAMTSRIEEWVPEKKESDCEEGSVCKVLGTMSRARHSKTLAKKKEVVTFQQNQWLE